MHSLTSTDDHKHDEHDDYNQYDEYDNDNINLSELFFSYIHNNCNHDILNGPVNNNNEHVHNSEPNANHDYYGHDLNDDYDKHIFLSPTADDYYQHYHHIHYFDAHDHFDNDLHYRELLFKSTSTDLC
ncbi:unnamed protein product [Zymoseptoria tritici ST99CH_1E4]|uniref:Uncharacterized protein n=1 Tax=Zymoseptoria tritici ST99CH_1E4 TaxID=1276532 RepID=A0A2H1GFL4_ZYMTR|nr:unnamed protein product [Zymoseptoria tritici ST99CH_1E4]